MAAQIQVIFHSLYSHVYQLAEAVAAGAREVPGAEVQLAQVAETLPHEILEEMGAVEAKKRFAHVPVADPHALADADAIILGSPTRYGSTTAQMQAFLDATGGLWAKGALIGKVGSAFTSTASQHGGQETTLVHMHSFFYHQGMVVAGVPYSAKELLNHDEISGGTPYGATTIAGPKGERTPTVNELAIARFQGRHVARIASKTQDRWVEVDDYLNDVFVPPDLALDAALRASAEAGLPQINVAPNQGKFLQLLARVQGARNILEIGTLGGYSTIWLARALPADGRLVTLEADPKHADVARGNIARAGLAGVVEIRLGPALETLPALAAEGTGPFDLTFIDADKASILDYFDWALRLSRPGSLIVVDNVVRKGAVADPTSEDPSVQGVRRFYERLAAEPGVSATAIQTVGTKGYDGFAVALVTGVPWRG